MILYKTILLFTVLYQTVMAQENYCHDKETNTYWGNLAIHYVDRMDVTNLVMLRKQRCRQIETGEISVEYATNIFVREREWVVEGLERGRF